MVVLEKAEKNWAAYSPDVPGCIATGRTPEETTKRYEKALRMHLQGLREDGLPLPEPAARAVTVELQNMAIACPELNAKPQFKSS